jgi:uncharacterized protein
MSDEAVATRHPGRGRFALSTAPSTTREVSMTSVKLHEVYRSIDSSDWDALECMLHADVVYERPGYDPLTGRERVLRFYRDERLVAAGRHEVYGVLQEGDRAACWGRMRGRLRDGSAADVQFADVYSFEAGTIRARRSYFFSPAV